MPQEAVQKLRQKYPGAYDDLSDQQLAARVIAKYPEYRDALGDIAKGPKDFVGQAKDFLTAEPTTPRPDYLGIGGPDLGKYVRTAGRFMLPESKGELARDVAMAAVPASKLLAPTSRILAPAAERTAYAAGQPLLESGDTNKSLQQGTAVGGVEALMALLKLPAAARAMLGGGEQVPGVSHAMHYPAGGGPVIVNRVNPGSRGVTVSGAGGSSITPGQVKVYPPVAGTPLAGANPSVIIHEPPGRAPITGIPNFLRIPTAVAATKEIEMGNEKVPAGLPATLFGMDYLPSLVPNAREAVR